MDLVQVHLKKDKEKTPCTAVLDLTATSPDDLQWLLQRKVISIPVLVRTVIALNQNGAREIYIQYLPAQKTVRTALENHRLIGRLLTWFEVPQGENSNADLHRKVAEQGGAYWVNPHYLINGVFLDAFEAQFNRDDKTIGESVQNQVSSTHVVWLPESFWRAAKNGRPLAAYVQSAPSKQVQIQDPLAYGQEIRSKSDVRKAEKLLFEDVTRKKGGVLAKFINEPISLWIAKHCAKVPLLTPNFITLLNTILGVLSAWLVYWGAQHSSYLALAGGAVLFYLVDIFDGIDGELARFTFRFSPRGALYDTISDNISLMCFITAAYYAAYMHVQRFWVIGSGIYTVAASIGAVLYLLQFTTKHFGNASLRLYEARYLPQVPKHDPVVRFIEVMKHFYTKDVLAALLCLPLLLNLPILIAVGAPLVISMMLVAFIYLGWRYSPERLKAAAH